MVRLVYDVKMWTSPYGSTQVMLEIDDDREVTLNPAQVLFVESEPHGHARARVLWNSGVFATGLLPVHDGGPGRTNCLLASQRSSMMKMGGRQLYQSTAGTCITPGNDIRGTHVKSNQVIRLYCFVVDGVDTVDAKPNTN